MIHVIAIITGKPGKRDEILRQFRANVPAVRAEQGCIEYGAAVDAENALKFQTKWGPDTFLAIEKWESMEALQAHAAAPHMAAYGAKTSGTAVKPAQGVRYPDRSPGIPSCVDAVGPGRLAFNLALWRRRSRGRRENMDHAARDQLFRFCAVRRHVRRRRVRLQRFHALPFLDGEKGVRAPFRLELQRVLRIDGGAVLDATLLGPHRGHVGAELAQDFVALARLAGNDGDNMDHEFLLLKKNRGLTPILFSKLRTSISREELANLPIRRYEGDVRLVESPERLAQEAEAIRRESVLGFDTETRPAFRKGESYAPALVQLAGESVVWIFALQRVDCSITLKTIFQDALFVKAGLGVADDLRQMKKVFPFEEANVVDIGTLAKRQGVEQTGLRNLAGLVLGYRIPKGSRTSNWGAARLTRQQIAYAAIDAWAARALYLRLAA